MRIIKAGVVKKLEFPNEAAKHRYLANLRVDGKNYYIIGEVRNDNKCFVEIVESWRNAVLIKNVTLV